MKKMVVLLLAVLHLNAEEIYATFDVKAEKSASLAFSSSGIVGEVVVDVASIVKKGDVLSVAQIGGILGVKKTSEVIPMCHNILIDGADLSFDIDQDNNGIHIYSNVYTEGKTGVEMEALTAVQVALLVIYDMCKAVDRGMVMDGIGLLAKSGGKSGTWQRSA